MGYSGIIKTIRAGDAVILDDAIGTDLGHCGVEMNGHACRGLSPQHIAAISGLKS